MSVRRIIQTSKKPGNDHIRYVFGSQLLSQVSDLLEYNNTIDHVLAKFQNNHSSNSVKHFIQLNSNQYLTFPSQTHETSYYYQSVEYYIQQLNAGTHVTGPVKKLSRLDPGLTAAMINGGYDCQKIDHQLLEFNFEKFNNLWLVPKKIKITPTDKISLRFTLRQQVLPSNYSVDLPVGISSIDVNGRTYHFDKSDDINFFYMYFKQIADNMYVPDLYYQKVDRCVLKYRQSPLKKQNTWLNLGVKLFAYSDILHSFDSLEFLLST